MTAEAVPAVELAAETANERLKKSFASWFWGSMIVATFAHFGTFAFWPEMQAEDWEGFINSLSAHGKMESRPFFQFAFHPHASTHHFA